MAATEDDCVDGADELLVAVAAEALVAVAAETLALEEEGEGVVHAQRDSANNAVSTKAETIAVNFFMW